MAGRKVYGFCDAGCKYEVLTKDEYMESAAVVELGTTQHSYTSSKIGLRSKFKVVPYGQDVTLGVDLGDGEFSEEWTINIENDTLSRGFFTFEIFYTGEYYAYIIDGQYLLHLGATDSENTRIKFTNIYKIYMYDTEAELLVKPENGITEEEARALIEEVIAEALEGEY